MTKPAKYLMPMVAFLVLIIILSIILGPRLESAFLSNVGINGVIVFLLIAGSFYILRQVARLKPEIDWIDAFEARSTEEHSAPPLLAPLANLARSGSLMLSPLSLRSMADGIASRLDERREISRYLVALLVFLGLLGTFWGLLGTILAIGKTINGLNVDSSDVPAMFEGLKAGLEAPLGGMGTAFSSSLFGLAGSLILGFLDLQLGQAQNRFFNELEDWLSVHIMPMEAPSADLAGAAGQSAAAPSAFMRTIMAQSADSLENMDRRMARGDAERDKLLSVLTNLQGTLDGLETRIDQQTKALLQLAETTRQPQDSGAQTADVARQLDKLNSAVNAIAQAQRAGQSGIADEIQTAASRLGRTLAAVLDQASAQNASDPDERG